MTTSSISGQLPAVCKSADVGPRHSNKNQQRSKQVAKFFRKTAF